MQNLGELKELRKGSRVMKRNTKKYAKKNINLEKVIRILFVFSIFFYCTMKIGLNSRNITLSVEEQRLAREMNQNQQEVEQLTTEVSQLEEKTRVLGLLDESVADNQKNVYIID